MTIPKIFNWSPQPQKYGNRQHCHQCFRCRNSYITTAVKFTRPSGEEFFMWLCNKCKKECYK